MNREDENFRLCRGGGMRIIQSDEFARLGWRIQESMERINSMKFAGWKCRFRHWLLLAAALLAGVPFAGQQAFTPAASPASPTPSLSPLSIAAASLPTPEPAQKINEKLAQLDQRITAAQSSADNSVILVIEALVLMMTGTGLALFYGGLVRQKNTLAIMMQSFALMALITVMWALVGYSLCFGDGLVIGGRIDLSGFIGGF